MRPFRLKDPSASTHLVRLAPKQSLELTVDVDESVHIASPFLTWDKIYKTREEEQCYSIKATGDITEFAHLTTHYLGEVMVGKDCKLILYQEGEIKKETITVINPFNDSIRIRPFETVEFIYCSDHDKKLTWTWEAKEDIDIEERAYQKSVAGKIPKVESNADYFAHPRELFKDGETLHHFWFTLGKGLLATMQEKPEKNLYVGRLSIEGSNEGDDYDDAYVDIYCDLKPKWRMRTVDFVTGKGVTQKSSRRSEKSLPTMMQVDFEALETKCVYAGCKTMEIKVES